MGRLSTQTGPKYSLEIELQLSKNALFH
jgi:hypothetical protein